MTPVKVLLNWPHANDVFSSLRKMIRPIRIPTFHGSCSLKQPRFASCSSDIHREKTIKWSFSCRKLKTSRTLERYSFVRFTVDKDNCRGPIKKNRGREQNRTRRKLKLYFLSETFLSCLILLKFIHFQLYITYNILRFLCHFVVCSGVFWHFRISERHEIKGWKNDKCLSMYVLNTIPYGKCFVPCLYKNPRVNTVRSNFPWIIYEL